MPSGYPVWTRHRQARFALIHQVERMFWKHWESSFPSLIPTIPMASTSAFCWRLPCSGKYFPFLSFWSRVVGLPWSMTNELLPNIEVRLWKYQAKWFSANTQSGIPMTSITLKAMMKTLMSMVHKDHVHASGWRFKSMRSTLRRLADTRRMYSVHATHRWNSS